MGDLYGKTVQVQEDFQHSFEDSMVLRFVNPVFHTGLNWTIRKGLRHASAAPGAEITLLKERRAVDELPVEVGQAIVTHILTCALADVPPFVFKGVHDPDLKNIVHLMDVLHKCYPGISGADTVTCVGFILFS